MINLSVVERMESNLVCVLADAMEVLVNEYEGKLSTFNMNHVTGILVNNIVSIDCFYCPGSLRQLDRHSTVSFSYAKMKCNKCNTSFLPVWFERGVGKLVFDLYSELADGVSANKYNSTRVYGRWQRKSETWVLQNVSFIMRNMAVQL